MIEFILSAPFVLCAVIGIAITIAILLEFERSGWATTFFSVGTALVLWAYKSEIWEFVSGNPLPTFYFALSYIAAGVVWSFFKWKIYIGKEANRFISVKETFLKTIGDTKENWKDWIDYLNSNLGHRFYTHQTPNNIADTIIPKANDKKSLIVSWISYWPMSVGATLLNNPFKRFFEWVYSLISGLYDKMGSSTSKKMLAGVEKGEEPTKPKKELLKN